MSDLNSRLMAAMSGQPVGLQQPQMAPGSRLASTMLGRARPGDAKYARLPALPPYGVARHAGSFGGQGAAATTGAFQSDAFQNDAFQV